MDWKNLINTHVLHRNALNAWPFLLGSGTHVKGYSLLVKSSLSDSMHMGIRLNECATMCMLANRNLYLN